MNQGIRTIIYPVKDLAQAKDLYINLLGVKPYADQPYYVGFRVGDQEIGLDPNSHKQGMTMPTGYYHVDDIKNSLQVLRDSGKIKPGQKVLINGASGGVGTFAVQIAKAFGAEVTAVCSPRNIDLVGSIGADHVIDYTQEDFTRNGQRYDLILAVNGYHPIFDYRRALTPNGIYVVAGGSLVQILQGLVLGPLLSKAGRQKMGFMGIAIINQKDLVLMKELLEAGKVVPVIEKSYPLGKAAEALQYLHKGHASGKVVISVEHNYH